jgi:HEXXH motif-containing protein
VHDQILFIHKLNDLDIVDVERACALDAWLQKVLGNRWERLKRSSKIDYDLRAQTSKSLWLFFLLATGLARKNSISLDQAIETAEKWIENPLRHDDIKDLDRGESYVALLLDHASVRENLKTASHPLIDDVMLSGFSLAEDINSHTATLTQAISMLKDADPVSYDLFNSCCGAVCYIKTEPQLPVGECVSLTSKLIPGLIYMTPVPTILTIESIVHETSHLYLTAVERLHKLYQSDELVLSTPLRPDPRPISGLMHQIWVLINLVRLYGGIRRQKNKIVEKNIESIIKRANLHRDQLIEGLTTMRENNDSLTGHGKLFLNAIASRVNELQ